MFLRDLDFRTESVCDVISTKGLVGAKIYVPGSKSPYIGDGHPTFNRESL